MWFYIRFSVCIVGHVFHGYQSIHIYVCIIDQRSHIGWSWIRIKILFTPWLVKITWTTGRFTLWLVKITWTTCRVKHYFFKNHREHEIPQKCNARYLTGILAISLPTYNTTFDKKVKPCAPEWLAITENATFDRKVKAMCSRSVSNHGKHNLRRKDETSCSRRVNNRRQEELPQETVKSCPRWTGKGSISFFVLALM